MTASDFIGLLLSIKGGHRFFLREGLLMQDGMAIPTVWISFHRQANKGIRKIKWEMLMPVGVLLILKTESHAFLRGKTSGGGVEIESKNTLWSKEEAQVIMSRVYKGEK